MIREVVDQTVLSKRHQLAIYCLAIFVSVLTVRVVAGNWESKFPIIFPDSYSFIKVANHGPLSLDFWFGERPLLTPLLLWLVGGGVREFILVQTLLYFVATAILCYVSLRLLRSRAAQIICVVCVLAVVVQSRYALWNTHLLSESLGMTTALLTIAAWLWHAHLKTRNSLTLSWVATTLWMLARDSNTAVALGIAGVIGIVGIASRVLRPQRESTVDKHFRSGLIAILLVGSFAYLGQNISGRNDNPVMNNIGQRVLPEPRILEWYESRGMPVTESLLERTGKNAFDDQWKMLNEPDLEKFRQWSRENGQLWQAISFVRFSPYWLGQSVDQIESKLAYDNHDYDIFKINERLPDGAWNGVGGPQSRNSLMIWFILALFSVTIVWQSKDRLKSGFVTILLISCFFDYIISWIGDSVEVNRHLVGCFFRTSIALSVILAIGIDTYLGENQKRTELHAAE